MIARALRRLWKLPRRCGSEVERCFVPMRDGVRLATWHFWPIDVRHPPPTILIRTPYNADPKRTIAGAAGRLLSESGYHVVVQDVRGRYASEGDFVPFIHEQRDGGDTLRWVADQSWSTGPIGLWGASYVSYTAWCALAEEPDLVGAVVSAIGGSDLYSVFYRGGALALANALEWGLGVGEREGVPARRIDLDRALAHRPIAEADRVGLRRVDWVRDWIHHHRRDAYWKEVAPPLPQRIPPVLSIGGWYDFFLECQLEEHAAIGRAVAERGGVPPRLMIGPWAHGLWAKLGYWREDFAGHFLRASIAHFDVHLRDSTPDPTPPPVQVFMHGADQWREEPTWPPEPARGVKLYLGASSEDRPRGVLRSEAVGGAPLTLRTDPDDPVPTVGGALFGLKAGIKDQRPLALRNDLVSYESEVFEKPLQLLGAVRVSLRVESEAADFDLAVRLLDVAADGSAENVCDGIQRASWRNQPPDALGRNPFETGPTATIEVHLGHAGREIGSGHRLRVVVGGTNFPRFDRNTGSDAPEATASPDRYAATTQRLHHDPDSPPWLELSVLGRPPL